MDTNINLRTSYVKMFNLGFQQYPSSVNVFDTWKHISTFSNSMADQTE